MVNHVVESLMASQAQSLVVVIGHDYAAVEAALPPSSGKGRGFTVTHNPDYTSGLASSLRRGLAALPDNIDGVLVCLGDMPRLSPAIVDRLIAAFNPVEGRAICRSEEHTSELQSLMRISYAVFCLKKKNIITNNITHTYLH